MSKLFRSALILLSIISLGFSLTDKVIETKVDKTRVETGEIFTCEIIVRGSFGPSAQLRLPEFKGLKIASQNQSRNYSLKGKVTTLTLTLTFHLFAPESGTYTIEPAILETKENKYLGRAITIKAQGKPLKDKMKILPYVEKGTNL
jgi:hypothetical protein